MHQDYYSLVAFNSLYLLGKQAELVCDTEELYSLAATDGVHHAMLISNLTGSAQELCIEGADLSRAKYHAMDNERLLSRSPTVSRIENNPVLFGRVVIFKTNIAYPLIFTTSSF